MCKKQINSTLSMLFSPWMCSMSRPCTEYIHFILYPLDTTASFMGGKWFVQQSNKSLQTFGWVSYCISPLCAQLTEICAKPYIYTSLLRDKGRHLCVLWHLLCFNKPFIDSEKQILDRPESNSWSTLTALIAKGYVGKTFATLVWTLQPIRLLETVNHWTES